MGARAPITWERWQAFAATQPAAVVDAVPQLPWEIERLHALRLAVRPVAVADLAWLFDVPLWRDEAGRRFRVTPNEVRRHPDRHPTQHARTRAADLDLPIHLAEHRGRWSVLDGVHRLLKADMLGVEALPAMWLSPADLASVSLPAPA
jgi:hypothetical protein